MAIRFNAKKAAEKGYTKADWDAVDSPLLTDEEIKSFRPAKEVLPPSFFDGLKTARKARGRPPKATIKTPVTIRLDPDVISKFKATGKGWQSRMNDALKAAKV
jgi:uncharacterized protein (DUF4415 family)